MLLRSSSSARYFAGFPIGFNIAVGGQLRDGSDATNLLTYMCLHAQADIGLTQPNLSVRVHAGSPQELLEAAAFVICKGSGMPQIFNDEVIVPGQVNRGLPLAEARNYAVVGCVELSTPGKALGWSDASMFNLTRVLELTLYGGKDPQSGEQIGLPTPSLDQMASFAELEAAYDRQLTYFVDLMVRGCNIVDGIHAEVLPSPLLSLFIADCVERGTDVTAGGARYNFSGVQGVQIANVADSLAAVKQAVFDEQWLPATQLLDGAAQRFRRRRSAAPAADQPRAQVRQRRRPRRSIRVRLGRPLLCAGGAVPDHPRRASTSPASTRFRPTCRWARMWGPRPTAAMPARRWPTAACRPRQDATGAGPRPCCTR